MILYTQVPVRQDSDHINDSPWITKVCIGGYLENSNLWWPIAYISWTGHSLKWMEAALGN